MATHAPLAPRPRNIATLAALNERLAPPHTTWTITSAAVVSITTGRAVLRAATGSRQLSVLVEAITDGVVRIKIARSVDDMTASAAAWTLIDRAPAAGSARVDDTEVVIDAGSVRAEVQLDPFHIRVVDARGGLLVEQQRDDFHATGETRGNPAGATVVGDAIAFHEWLRVRPDEHFYGLGESSTGLDKRGQHSQMWTSDAYGVGSPRAYKPVPLLVSTAGYGLLVDSGLPVEFDIARASASSLSIVAPDNALDYYVIGGSPTQVLGRYHALTGMTAIPPRWSFGLWMSTGFLPQTQATVEAWLDELQRLDFPCDVVHIDPYWMKAGLWSDLHWDRDAFPDPQAMLARLRAAGIRTCLWINPYISIASPEFAVGDRAGYFLRDAQGESWHGAVWGDDVEHPDVAIVDFTNAAARSWFQGLLASVLRDGVDVFKTDFGEGVPADTVASNGLSGLELHNVYPLLYNEAVADITEKVHGHRLVWGRASFIGGQRFPAQWGGDTAATWEGMASSLRAGLSYSMSGYTFWSHDVGGFSGRPTPDLFARWAQWGALSPLTRLHGTSSRIPWEWDDTTHRRVRQAIEERYRLLPYILWQASACARHDIPLLRPLVHAEPEDPGTWHSDSSYLFGSDLLVAPIRDEIGSQLTRLPAGSWIDASTGELLEGHQFIARKVTSPDASPVFVRAGAIIPTSPGRARVPEGAFDHLTLDVWGPRDRTVVIDDSVSRYEVRTHIEGNRLHVTISGDADVTSVRVFAAATEVTSVSVNGVVWASTSDHGVLVVERRV